MHFLQTPQNTYIFYATHFLYIMLKIWQSLLFHEKINLFCLNHFSLRWIIKKLIYDSTILLIVNSMNNTATDQRLAGLQSKTPPAKKLALLTTLSGVNNTRTKHHMQVVHTLSSGSVCTHTSQTGTSIHNDNTQMPKTHTTPDKTHKLQKSKLAIIHGANRTTVSCLHLHSNYKHRHINSTLQLRLHWCRQGRQPTRQHYDNTHTPKTYTTPDNTHKLQKSKLAIIHGANRTTVSCLQLHSNYKHRHINSTLQLCLHWRREGRHPTSNKKHCNPTFTPEIGRRLKFNNTLLFTHDITMSLQYLKF